MGFRINTNIAAMAAHNNATMNNRAMDQSLGRLSSGLRITKAADDASGMVIANSLRSQANSLGQAVNNGNDAIGLIQTADGALDEYSKILDTIKTKSIQAASDGQNTTSRQAIQKDIDRLMENLGNIAKTTSFNGQTLLSGNFTNKQFQVGADSNQSINVSIASAETTKVGLTTRTTLDMISPNGGDVSLNVKSSITGEEIQMKSVNIAFNNEQQNGMGALADEVNKYSGDTGIRANAVVEATTAVAIGAGSTGADFAINGEVIGSVIVSDNDDSGSLLSAINSKTSLTGVAATLNQDGSMQLTSGDGRAIKVDGDIAAVFGTSNADMTTIGHLELVQSGASEFQITNESVGAVGFDMLIGADLVTTEDSTIAAGSTLITASILKQGSTIGGDTTITGFAVSNADSLITEGSELAIGAIFKEGTTLGGDVTGVIAAGDMNSDTTLAAGSVITTLSTFSAGTEVTTQFTDSNGDIHNVGDVLSADTILAGALTLSADMTIVGSSTAELIAGTVFNTGSTVGADLTSTTAVVDIEKDMTLITGSTLITASVLTAGSVLGDDATTSGPTSVLSDMTLKAGSTVIDASTLAAGSTIGGDVVVDVDSVLQADMSISSGSTLATGTILKAGTVMQQDLTVAVDGIAVNAGDSLEYDLTTTAAIVLTKDMTMIEGSTIESTSALKANDGKSATVELGTTTNSALANIDVTTLEGAMKAIDTLSAAITSLDTIRADLGSAQNQMVSTINNISVTQVNVKAAESQLRDVDFAAESANFSKLNILAQSGSYAMSQANAVQQNVLRLLQ